MEYLPGKKEYSPRELYESFGDKLPLIVVCTQGFLGDQVRDTVEQGRVSHRLTHRRLNLTEKRESLQENSSPCFIEAVH